MSEPREVCQFDEEELNLIIEAERCLSAANRNIKEACQRFSLRSPNSFARILREAAEVGKATSIAGIGIVRLIRIHGEVPSVVKEEQAEEQAEE